MQLLFVSSQLAVGMVIIVLTGGYITMRLECKMALLKLKYNAIS